MSYIPKILDVLTWPDPKLKELSTGVTVFDEELENYVTDMFATMRALNGVGLSAPQTGRLKRIITIRLEEDKPLVIINPKITILDKEEYEWEEGCLSVPGYFKKRKRPANIAVQYQDVTGKIHS